MEIQKLFVSLLLDAAEYTDGLGDAQKEASSFRDRIGQTIGDGFKIAQGVAVAAAAAVAAAVVGIGVAAFGVSSDVATATANIQAELGTTAEEAERLGDIATDVWGNNFAGSITEAAGAVGLIRQQIGDLSDNELQNATENAFRLQDVFGVEVPESVDAAKTLMEQFGLTSEEAFDFIAKGFQNGLNRSDDFLDTIGEYSVQFASGGADAGEFFSLLESGLQGGMLGTDKAADAFKEFRVRIQDGSDATAEALEMVGISSDELLQGMADGTVTAADAFTLVMDALNNVDDENIRMQAGVGLLGTQFEDLGTEGALALSLVGTELSDMTGAVGSLDAKYNTLGSAAEGYKRRALLALQPIGDLLLTLANNAMPLVDQAFGLFETSILPIFEDLGNFVNGFTTELSNGLSVWDAAIEALLNWTNVGEANFMAILNIVQGIEQFIAKAQEVLQPVIDWIANHVKLQDVLIVLGIFLASVLLPLLGSLILSILTIAAPIVAAIAIVALLRTAWEQNWGGIQEKTAAAIEFVRNIITTVMEKVRAFWAENGEAIMAKAKEIWDAIQTHIDTTLAVIKSVFDAFKSAFEGDWTGFGENLRAAADTAWEYIKTTFGEAGANILAWLSGFILDMLAKFRDTDWTQLAQNVIDGLLSGLANGAAAVVAKVREIGQAAWDAWNGFWNSNSPSKLAMEGAGYVTSGILVQWDRDEDVLARAAGQLGAAAYDRMFGRDVTAQSATPTAVPSPATAGARGRGVSLTLINPQFHGVSDVPTFIDQLEELAAT